MNYPNLIKDEQIILRQPTAGDAQELLQAVRESLNELNPWIDWATDSFDILSARRLLEIAEIGWANSTRFQFVIQDAFSGDYLGGCTIDGINEATRQCNNGYWVRSSRTKQGAASRAIRLAAQFAFDVLKLSRVEIVVAAENIGSIKAAKKAGARFEQVLKNGLVIRTSLHDAHLFSIIRADFHPDVEQ